MNHVKAAMLQEQRTTPFHLCHSLPKRFTQNSFTRHASQQCQSRQPIYKTTLLILKTPFVLMFGLVTKALSRNEWLSDPKALEAIRKESDGLRSNQTWDDETACDADELTRQSKILSKDIKSG